jgi:lipopolysaccharide transport system ATP-binding protein
MRKIITVENLSKLYHIGARQAPAGSLRESVGGLLKKPHGWMRRNGQDRREALWALKDVSFDVERGEVVGVIGSNGAGKSTLLKILSRITEPTAGRIRLYGKVGSLIEVGTGFHPELTGRENIYLNGAILGMHRHEIDNKFDEIVTFAELEKFIDTPVKRYSSGMYMRLAFAVAAHLEPEILIVDEVLAVGDATFQKKCLGKMGNVAREGRTILFVSHNLAAIQSLCNTGLVLRHGVAEFFGPVQEAINHYNKSLRAATPTDVKDVRGVRVLSTRVCANPDDEDSDQTTLTSDSPLVASIDFYTDRRLPKCYLNLVIEDMEGRFLIHSRTDLFDTRPTFEAGRHSVKIEIPRLSLRAGIYNLWFRLYVNSDNMTEIVDSEHVPLYVNGPPIGGVLDVECRWSWGLMEMENYEP